MAQLDLDPVVDDLLAPTIDRLRAILGASPGPDLRVTVGERPDYFVIDGTSVVLSTSLLGPDLHHPRDAASLVPVDRWRRAAASVLEAATLVRLGETSQVTWQPLGFAIWQAHRWYPELQVALADLARARQNGGLSHDPRAGYAVFRAIECSGSDPTDRFEAWRQGTPVPVEDFLAWGRWVLAADGAQAELPVPVPRPPEVDIPCTLQPFSWQRLSVPANMRGGQIEVAGPGLVDDPWGVSDQPLTALACATEAEVRLTAAPGGPVGRWQLRSADGFGQVMGARGFTLTFERNGTITFELADAFVGPIAALEMAERMGTSGLVRGRWQVAGPFLVSLTGLDTSALTMHGHQDPFVLPAQGLGLAQSIQAMTASPWRWQIAEDLLSLKGSLQGASVEVRLARA
ncbi:MAG: hypothetical protein AAGA48_29695 [Myxococcota bacterium]